MISYVSIASVIANNVYKEQLTVDKMEFANVKANFHNLKAKYGPMEEEIWTCQLEDSKEKNILVSFMKSPRKMVFGFRSYDIDYIADLRLDANGNCYVPEVKETAETFVIFDDLKALFPNYIQKKNKMDKFVSILYKNYKKKTIGINDFKKIFNDVEYTQDPLFNRMIRATYGNYTIIFIHVEDPDHIKMTSRIGISEIENDPAEMIYSQ